MLDLCKNAGLRICNGRLGKNCDKNYTFYCRRGRSVVLEIQNIGHSKRKVGYLLDIRNIGHSKFDIQILVK